MSDIDFEEQLKQEELAKEEEAQGGLTKVDDDGTVMEWDSLRKAWFPKIDDDFIAQYQMSYGSHELVPSQETTTSETYSEDYYKDYNDYYNYYYQQYQTTGQDTQQSSEVTEAVSSKSASEPDYDHYFEQYKQDFDEGYKIEDHQEPVDPRKNAKVKKKKKEQTVEPKRPEGWFEVDEDNNTNVYISGLPTDITDDEYKELMSKCGLIMFDPFTKKPKLKLYKDENGQPKGDGRCCYIKVESVELALQLLDESDFRGNKIHVEKAKFQMKGNFDPNKKKRKLNNKEKRKFKEKQAKLFDWRPEKNETSRFKFEKVIIFKNMFDPKDFEENPLLINELRDDVREECCKIGDCKKVVIYDRHPDGVMSATFKDAETADECVEKLNHRWFAKRRIIAQTWDGVTKYEIEETDAEREARMKKWENFLGDSENNPKKSDESLDEVQEVASSSGKDIVDSAVVDSETKKLNSETISESPQSQVDISQSENLESANTNTTGDIKNDSRQELT